MNKNNNNPQFQGFEQHGLTDHERFALTSSAYDDEEIALIDKAVKSGRAWQLASLPIEEPDFQPLINDVNVELYGKTGQPQASIKEHLPKEELASLENDGEYFYGSDRGRTIEEVYSELGVTGVICCYPRVFVDERKTGFTMLGWETIQHRFLFHELHPTPTKKEIETACGLSGLNVPRISFKGQTYYDFYWIGKSEVHKQVCRFAYSQIREVVCAFLIRSGPLPEEPNL
jgi:hypothetical protein